MTPTAARQAMKRVLGALPLTAEVAQRLRVGGAVPIGGYALEELHQALPSWAEAARQARVHSQLKRPKRILVIGYLRWWLEYACALGLFLSGAGHSVGLGILPYRRWNHPVESFDLRRQRLYLRRVLRPLTRLIRVHDLSAGVGDLPMDLSQQIERLSCIDVEYTRNRETLDLRPGSDDAALLRLRDQRNREAARAALSLLGRHEYDIVVIPNGSILEFGAIYRAARHLGVPAVTYEFGEQRQRMWLARDDEVMRLDASALWEARKDQRLTDAELSALQELYRARRAGRLWQQFGRLWQAGESHGAQAARKELGLDLGRPVVLLCTNVVGDSLALNRQVFTAGMAEWLALTVRFFAERPQFQLVVRVHPAELILAGEPSVEIVRSALPEMPGHVVVVPPESKVNTYDLVELAHLGLAYTTTVGMEMSMSGIPVVVAGRSHYRGKGFTYDPESLAEYQEMLETLLVRPRGARLDSDRVELAIRYAYRFFFEYPFPFPWHLVQFWDDIRARPLEAVLSQERRPAYQRTLDALAGGPIVWN